MPGWNLHQIKQKLSIILRLNNCYLKIIGFLHPCYHLKILRSILKMYKKQVCLFKGYMIHDNENETENEK